MTATIIWAWLALNAGMLIGAWWQSRNPTPGGRILTAVATLMLFAVFYQFGYSDGADASQVCLGPAIITDTTSTTILAAYTCP